MRPWRLATAALLGMLVLVGSARAEDGVAVLTLDGLSFLTFESAETLPIPAGSSLRFRFSSGTTGSSRSFTIEPQGVSIAPIALGGGNGTLRYGLARSATGTLARSDGGFTMSFTAGVSVTRIDGESSSHAVYTLQFTTERASATGTKTGTAVSIDGMKVVPQARYLQLVGAVSNGDRAALHPGRAVHMVLSGTFDWLPALD